MITIV